jgi:hypothetical protein
MSDSKMWRWTVILCVAAVCFSLIYCCSLLKPARYERIESATGATRVLDNQTGDMLTPKFK